MRFPLGHEAVTVSQCSLYQDCSVDNKAVRSPTVVGYLPLAACVFHYCSIRLWEGKKCSHCTWCDFALGKSVNCGFAIKFLASPRTGVVKLA